MAEPTRTRLIQIGEMAGPILKLPAAAWRSSGLEVMGSGGGSISPAVILEAFPRLWEAAAKGELRIDTEPVFTVCVGSDALGCCQPDGSLSAF